MVCSVASKRIAETPVRRFIDSLYRGITPHPDRGPVPVGAWPAACFLAGAARLIDTGLRTFAAPRARRDPGHGPVSGPTGPTMTGVAVALLPGPSRAHQSHRREWL